MMAFEHSEAFLVELQRFAPIKKIVHALEQALVEQDLRLVRRETGPATAVTLPTGAGRRPSRWCPL